MYHLKKYNNLEELKVSKRPIYHISKDENKHILDDLFLKTDILISDDLFERFQFYKNSITLDDIKCTFCINKKSFSFKLKDWNQTCGDIKCIEEASKMSMQQKYGFDNITKAINSKSTEHLTSKQLENINSVQSKIKSTNQEKYQHNFAIAAINTRNKIKVTNLKKYGFDSHFKDAKIAEKRRTSFLKTVLDNKMSERLKNHQLSFLAYKDKYYHLHCEKCQQDFEIHYEVLSNRHIHQIPICVICNPVEKLYSIAEKEIANYIKSLGFEVIENYRKFKKELDIFIPTLNIGIEYNGLYWHSIQHKDINYHSHKQLLFAHQSIQVYTIWEDEWIYKQNIVKSKLKHLLNKCFSIINSDDCQLLKVDTQQEKAFLEANHIEGYIKSDKCYGLYFKDKLVSVMSLKKQEILRHCHLLNITVIGVISKLIKRLSHDVIFYDLLSWTEADVYKKLGFISDEILLPNHFYFKNNQRLMYEDVNTSIIYDAGKQKWIYKYKK